MRVVFEFARFSVMTLRGARWAARAEALMERGSLSGMPRLLCVSVDGGLQRPELTVQELEDGGVVERVARHARHLVVDVDGVAVRAGHRVRALDEAQVQG